MPKAVTWLDLQHHINRDYRQVHQQSWTQMKDYIDSAFTVVEEDQIDDEMTFDGAWKTFTISSRTGYTNQRYVFLSIECKVEGAGSTCYLEINRYNLTSGWRHRIACMAGIYDLDENVAIGYNSAEVKVPIDSSGRFNYKGSADGTQTIKIVGYDR